MLADIILTPSYLSVPYCIPVRSDGGGGGGGGGGYRRDDYEPEVATERPPASPSPP